MSQQPFYRWFPGDYLQDTVHLSIHEDCLYRRLLDLHWRDGSLPVEHERLAKLARFSLAEFEDAWKEVSGYFVRRGDRLINVRINSELRGVRRKIDQKRSAGKASAAKRLRTAVEIPLNDPDPDLEEEKNKNPPIVPPNGGTVRADGTPPEKKNLSAGLRFEEWWQAYGKKVEKKRALAIWKRRGLDAKADMLIEDARNRHAHDEQWRRGYQPHPSTYLNGDRWEDEVTFAEDKPNGDPWQKPADWDEDDGTVWAADIDGKAH